MDIALRDNVLDGCQRRTVQEFLVLAAVQRCNCLLRLLDRVVDLLQFFLDFLRLAQIAVTGF